PAPGPRVIQLPTPGANSRPANDSPASAPPAAAPSDSPASSPPAAAPSNSPPASGTKPRRQSSNEQTPTLSVPDLTAAMFQSPTAPANETPAPAPPPAAAPLSDKLPVTIGGPALRAAALGGDAAAQYEVGIRFADGRGVAQNGEEAVRWLDRSAKAGFAPALFRLGGLYEKAIGVKKDLVASRDYYRAAADKGHSKATHNLAVLYAEGVEGAAQ